MKYRAKLHPVHFTSFTPMRQLFAVVLRLYSCVWGKYVVVTTQIQSMIFPEIVSKDIFRVKCYMVW